MTNARLAPAEPDGAPRLPLLDILRGVAILGILFMNISDMGASLYAFFERDPRRLGWGGLDQAAWWAREVLASGTARCLLEMLFGAGMVILTERAASRMDERAVLRSYAWRNIVLFGFGVAHAVLLLWPGDILHTYAMATLIAVWFRTLRPRLLITLGLGMATLQLLGVGAAIMAQTRQADEARAIEVRAAQGVAVVPSDRARATEQRRPQAALQSSRAERAKRVSAEDSARTGTAASWAAALWGVSGWLLRSGWELLFIWEAASTMLIGAALYKLGVLQGARSRRFYSGLMVAGYAIGLGLRIWATTALTRFDGAPTLAAAFGEYARLATTLGHIGLLALIATSGRGTRWLRPFGAAGRTALTLYALQTLVCLWVLYPPWGLRLYNQQGWAALMATALAVNAALLLLAVWWANRFPIAPVEWAWRSIVAGRRLPFARPTST